MSRLYCHEILQNIYRINTHFTQSFPKVENEETFLIIWDQYYLDTKSDKESKKHKTK